MPHFICIYTDEVLVVRVASYIYEATLTTSNTKHTYIGLTEGNFKTRFNGRKQKFRHEKYRNSSEISKKVWELKDKGSNYNLTWRVLQQRGRR